MQPLTGAFVGRGAGFVVHTSTHKPRLRTEAKVPGRVPQIGRYWRKPVYRLREITILGALAATILPAAAIDISGAGATFPYPLYSKWADAYRKETGVGLNYQSIGSGGGIKQIEARTVTFGATDAPLKGPELDKHGLVQFPMVMGGIVPVFNIDGIARLVLDGPTLAAIFLGTVKTWDDPAIKKLNPNADRKSVV